MQEITQQTKRIMRDVVIVCATITLTGSVLFFGAWMYAERYSNLTAPNIYIGTLHVGEKSRIELEQILQAKTDEILTKGISVQINTETKTLPLSNLIGSDFIEYVDFDVSATAQNLLQIHHSDNPIFNTAHIFLALLRPTKSKAEVVLYAEPIRSQLHAIFASEERPPSETQFLFSEHNNVWSTEILPGVVGEQVDDQLFLTHLKLSLERLNTQPIKVTKTTYFPQITTEMAERQISVVNSIFAAAPFQLRFQSENKPEQTWKLDAKTLASMLTPTPTNNIGILQEPFDLFVEPIAKQINVPAQNARFKIVDNRATEFAVSKNGYKIDTDTLYQNLLTQLPQGSTTPITIQTIVDEPVVKTSEVNQLGITESLGRGVSSYKNSPKNRRVNIQTGVDLLNGRLIAPDETFSLIAALKPFTLENGYLNELVIRGTKIEPDIGGGLCQIGTTAFRAVMNSGLDIAERRNHSLVVSYYNDPSNNNPGTDATIFDPAPDFKFTNNTGNYILFQAENNTESSELIFTFWGTSDGRKGEYTPPVVKRWIPYGEEIIQTSTSLQPGEKKCQEAHKGADTTFTYIVTRADGTKEERVFDSHYRPLPKICLVGVTPEETPPVTEQEVDPPEI